MKPRFAVVSVMLIALIAAAAGQGARAPVRLFGESGSATSARAQTVFSMRSSRMM